MARSCSYDFVKDNGLPVTVDFTYSPGSETTYSPMNGACGGDPCEVSIDDSWPNTNAFNELYSLRNDLDWTARPLWKRPVAWIALQFVEIAVWYQHRSARLTDAERERMEAWIAENHVYEPYEEDYY